VREQADSNMIRAIRAGLDMDGRTARLALFALALLLIVINGGVALIYLRDLHHTVAKADTALQFMRVLKETEDLARATGRSAGRAQPGADRGTQDLVSAQLGRLRDLVSDNSEQLKRVDGLTRLIEQNAAAMAAEPAASEPQVADRTNAVVATLDAMLVQEQELLHQRLAATESRNTIRLAAGTLVRTAAIVLVVAIVAVIYRKARGNERLAEANFRALQESDHRFRRVFEESPLGMLLARQDDQRIIQANPALCRMLGYSADEMVGMNIPAVTHADDHDVLHDAVGRASTPDHVVEARWLTRSGGTVWARVRLTELSTIDGGPALLLALVEDITHEQQVEAELRQAQKMEAVGQLTGGIAHDFNNLLGVIIGNCEFLLDALRDRRDEADLAREILTSALGGADLTRRLLAFARRQALQPRRVDLNAYLPNHVAMLRRVLGDAIEITPDYAANLWPTRADPSQVGDALLNLAINARDAMPHGGHVTIKTANLHLEAPADDGGMAPGDYVVLSVTDTGVGMEPDVLERVVEPFFTTKEPGAGSGLGLSMIYGFARQSGGHLRIESRLGHGTTVRLYLPRALGDEAEDSGPATVSSLPRGDESILLVDDNPELRATGRRHLLALGYRVTEAEDGPTALALIRGKGHYDLLFTDIAMPHGMTGYQLAASAQQIVPGLKVLFTTGYTGPAPRGEPARPPPGAMIAKPYRISELAVTMRAALDA
jgi:PAS domain S-box-containing protein